MKYLYFSKRRGGGATYDYGHQDRHLVYPFQIACTQVPTPAVEKKKRIRQKQIRKVR